MYLSIYLFPNSTELSETCFTNLFYGKRPFVFNITDIYRSHVELHHWCHALITSFLRFYIQTIYVVFVLSNVGYIWYTLGYLCVNRN